jgi:hypothetical protein
MNLLLYIIGAVQMLLILYVIGGYIGAWKVFGTAIDYR